MAPICKLKITCFAYGSNMLSARMCQSDRVPSARPVGIGYVTGYRLTFDKVSRNDGSGKCDAEWTGNVADRVYGVIYSVDKAEKTRLDKAEGLNDGYKQRSVPVVTNHGEKNAVMYYATCKDPSLQPYHWYKALVIAGAVEHGLPFGYIELLRTVDSHQDEDVIRRAEHERLLTTPQQITRSSRNRRKRHVG